jgi:hypothetical protein
MLRGPGYLLDDKGQRQPYCERVVPCPKHGDVRTGDIGRALLHKTYGAQPCGKLGPAGAKAKRILFYHCLNFLILENMAATGTVNSTEISVPLH